mgnify:FL=1
MKNPVKAKLKAGKPSIGTWITIGHPDVAEFLATLGFDWFVFDMEHSPISFETVQVLMQASSFSKTVPLVRVAWNDMVLIKRALDIGAYGVVIPWVNTKEDAINAVKYCRYPPRGLRGCGPRRAAVRDPEYFETVEEELLVVVQIETEEALKNIDDILTVEGIDACYIGPNDLSMNLGVFRQWGHPKFRKALEIVLDACKRYGVAPGMHCNINNINEALEMGFKFCAIDSDYRFLLRGAREAIERVEGWSPQS